MAIDPRRARTVVATAVLVLAGTASQAAFASTEPPNDSSAGDAEFQAACVFLGQLPSTIDEAELRTDDWVFGEPNVYRLMAATGGFQAAGAADANYADVAEDGQLAWRAYETLNVDEIEVHLGPLREACAGAPGASPGADGADDSIPAELPGGSAGVDVLEEAGQLDGGLVVWGPVAPDDAAVNAAVCDYVFGTVDEVRDLALLDGEVTLADGSGIVSLGGGGNGVRCTYDLDGEPTFQLRLWSQPAEFDEGDPQPVVQFEAGRYAALAIYDPDHEGDRILEDTATAWLTEAADRVGGGSV